MNISTIENIKCKKYIHFIIGWGILFCVLINVNAQQTPLYSQYTLSPFVINPAAAGADNFTTIILTNRTQWLGVEGVPRVYSVSAQARMTRQNHITNNRSVKKKYRGFSLSRRAGLGLNVYNFHAGQIDQTGAKLTYAYHYTIKRSSQFSMGMSLGFLKYKINTNKLQLIDQTVDPVYYNKISFNLPDANFGIYYSDQNKYIGLSIIQLLQASAKISNYEYGNIPIYRQYYLIGGYKYKMNQHDELESSFYLKTSEQLNFQMDLSIKYIHDSKFWIGIGYRSALTFMFSAGVHINKFYFGYAYDYSPRGLLNYSYGSHEIMLAIKIGGNVKSYKYLNRY